MKIRSTAALLLAAATGSSLFAEPVQLSGIYPSLTMFNNEGECGTGAVVPWGDSLWVVTYAPHGPKGSSDKLYQISGDLVQTIRPESIGGTPANRMIHKESGQLFIGPHAISSKGDVRTIPYSEMFGRPTGNARHLTDPANKILCASMEEGIYEIDVKSLKVTELWGDEQVKSSPRKANLPGYHGKGFFSGQGVYVYSNNGEHGSQAMKRPDVPSGVLAEWDGKADKWTVVRRNQFTEVTGPGGIHGSANPATDPIWASGWDAKSQLLGVRMPDTGWTFYRLPKSSHSYDGAHGWNTEWPRIRDIGEDTLLMTMHGAFWSVPKDFTPENSAGITPRSNYLKVIGDFSRWNDRIVFGCDDTAKNEFLNKRRAKGHIAAPQSQSNLWFVELEKLDHFGPVIGRGMVWLNEDIAPAGVSDAFLFSGYDHRMLHLSHRGDSARTVTLEVDVKGNGAWQKLRSVEIPAKAQLPVYFTAAETGTWIRLRTKDGLKGATAAFSYRNKDTRNQEAHSIFQGIASKGDTQTGGLIRARGGNKKSLSFAAVNHEGSDIGYYELDADLKLTKKDDPAAWDFTKKNTTIPTGAITVDEASVLYIDDNGGRWRLPKSDRLPTSHPLGDHRVVREVATERDLFNAHGTFYELPARNAGGFAKVRPVATHHHFIHDFCSYRGLFVVSGIATDAPKKNPNIIHSDDGKTALWAGAIDDVWKLGKPRGTGGPWLNTKVKAGEPSDPYLMTAYDKKSLQLRFEDPDTDHLSVTLQIDPTGYGDWIDFKTFDLGKGQTTEYEFPDAFSAYWVRFVSDSNTTVTAQLTYR